MNRRAFVAIAGIALASVLVGHVGVAWAKVSGGGSRGSRSYSAPSRPSSSPAAPTTPSSPSRSLSQPAAPAPMAPQRPSFFRGMMGAVAGFAIGGLIGSLLFGGLGHGLGGLGGFGGFGLLEILLIGGGLLLLWSYLRRRRQAEQPAYATAGAPMSSYGAGQESSSRFGGLATPEMPAARDEGAADLERGLGYIRQMDPGFDPIMFAERIRTEFSNVQSILAVKDVDVLRDRLTPEMYSVLKAQCDGLKAAGRTDYVQKIDLERSDVTEAWQENGQDFVTVYFKGSMIDYTVDDRAGQVVEGSKTDPQTIEEFWTFTRPVGPNRWKLSAIQSA